jgi:hypothetical protein
MEPSKWEVVLISWMNGKSVKFQQVPDGTTEVNARDDFQIVDLEKMLFDRGLILEFLRGDDNLYNVLIRRMQLQFIYSVAVPQRVQMGCTFGGVMNCRRMLLHDIFNGLDKSKRHLEKKNGVNLDYYYKMSESTKRSEEAKQAAVCHQNEMREGAKKVLFIYNLFKKIVRFVLDYCPVRMVLLDPGVY